MRIVDAKVIVCCPGRNFVTLKLVTEDGVYGLGDATLNGRELAVALRPGKSSRRAAQEPEPTRIVEEAVGAPWAAWETVRRFAKLRGDRTAAADLKQAGLLRGAREVAPPERELADEAAQAQMVREIERGASVRETEILPQRRKHRPRNRPAERATNPRVRCVLSRKVTE